MSALWARIGARILRATTVVDTAHRVFDRARSVLVARYAPDEVMAAYSDLIYASTSVYRADSPNFREGLFNWETDLVRQVLPPPPGRLLLGGAGGGREAFALVALGYDVVAFEPSLELAKTMADRGRGEPRMRALVGRYEDLPVLRGIDGETPVDLAALGPFVGGIFGWTSYAHIRHRPARVAALRAFGRLTGGPVIVSVFPFTAPPYVPDTLVRRVGQALGLAGSPDEFLPYIGVYHQSAAADIEAEVTEAGLAIVASSYDDSDGRWPWVAARRIPTA